MNEAVLLAATSFALNAAWQAGLLTLTAWSLDRWLRRLAPASRHWLWLAVCGLSVLLPLATMDFPSGFTVAAEQAVSGVREPVAAAAWPVARVEWQLPVAELLQWLVLAIIAGGAAVRLVRLARGCFALAALRRRAVPHLHRTLKSVAAQCADGLGFTREVCLYRVQGLAGPITYGLRRAVVLIPADLDHEDDDLLVAVFGHELAHAKRRDFLLNLLCEAALMPLAWHPAAGLIRRRLEITREAACDELVASMLADRKRYAQSLLRIAAASMVASPGLGMSDGGELEQRIRGLMVRPLGASWQHLAGSAASILLTGALASFGMVRAVAPPFEVSARSVQGAWEGNAKGYALRLDFTGRALDGRVEIGPWRRPEFAPAQFVFGKVGDPPKMFLPPPPPPPPPPANKPAAGSFTGTRISGQRVVFRIESTDYRLTFDDSGNALLRVTQGAGGKNEFQMALRRVRPTN